MDTSTPDFTTTEPRTKPFKEYFFVEKNLPDIDEDHFLVRRHLLRQSRQREHRANSSFTELKDQPHTTVLNSQTSASQDQRSSNVLKDTVFSPKLLEEQPQDSITPFLANKHIDFNHLQTQSNARPNIMKLNETFQNEPLVACKLEVDQDAKKNIEENIRNEQSCVLTNAMSTSEKCDQLINNLTLDQLKAKALSKKPVAPPRSKKQDLAQISRDTSCSIQSNEDQLAKQCPSVLLDKPSIDNFCISPSFNLITEQTNIISSTVNTPNTICDIVQNQAKSISDEEKTDLCVNSIYSLSLSSKVRENRKIETDTVKEKKIVRLESIQDEEDITAKCTTKVRFDMSAQKNNELGQMTTKRNIVLDDSVHHNALSNKGQLVNSVNDMFSKNCSISSDDKEKRISEIKESQSIPEMSPVLSHPLESSTSSEPLFRPQPIVFGDASQIVIDGQKPKNMGVVRPTTKTIPVVEESEEEEGGKLASSETSKNRFLHQISASDKDSCDDMASETGVPFFRSQSMRTSHYSDRGNSRRHSATKQVDINGVLLSDKDKKMLSLFIAKREKEREEERLRQQTHKRWEEERYGNKKWEEERCGNKKWEEERFGNKKWEEERFGNKSNRRSVIGDNRHAHAQTKQTRDGSNGSVEGRCNHRSSSDCLATSCNKYIANLDMQQITKKNEIAKSKMYQAIEKKKAVEQRLEEQKEMTAKYLKELKEKQESELERAANTKRTQHDKLKQKAMLMNKQTQLKQQHLKESRAAKIHDIPSQHDSMDAMLSAAEEKARRRREEDIAKIKSVLQAKIDKSQEKQRAAEDELKKWQEQIALYRQQQDKHAEQLKMGQLAKKKEVVSKQRETKEKQQKENMQKMLDLEQDWKESVLASINQKSERSRFIQKEKNEFIQRSRAQAHVTRMMRDEVRMNQSMTDLDQLTKHVFYNRLQMP